MLILDILSILLVISILIIIISYLVSVNKKLNLRIQQEKNRFILYKKELWTLDARQSYGKKDLDAINKLGRDFFKERFNISYNLSYIEIADIFKKDILDERVEFCDRMSRILYAGEKLDSKEVKTLIELLLNIIENYKYL